MKRCLVLGGSGNIGSAVLRVLVREGAKVAFTYYARESEAAALATELSAAGYARCDFADPASIAAAVSELVGKLGGLDALVCTVGTPGKRFDLKLGEIRPEDLDACLDVNARGVLLACQAARPALADSPSGSILIVGSMDGFKAVPSPIHFATSKSALKGMVESMARELGPDGVKVNLLVPGVVEGGASVHLTEALKKEYLKYCSMKRFAKASEIAEAAVWFGLENTYVTGQAILLNGGL